MSSMFVSELVSALQALQEEYGDVRVYADGYEIDGVEYIPGDERRLLSWEEMIEIHSDGEEWEENDDVDTAA